MEPILKDLLDRLNSDIKAMIHGELEVFDYSDLNLPKLEELADSLNILKKLFLSHSLLKNDDHSFISNIKDNFVNPLINELQSGKSESNIDFHSAIHTLTDTLKEKFELEKALKEREQILTLLFEKSGDPQLLIKGDKFIDCNEKALQMVAAKNKEHIIGKTPDYISPNFQPDGLESITKAQMMIFKAFSEGHNRFEWVHKKIDGSLFNVEVTLTAIPMQGEWLLHTSWRDITERIITQQALQENELKYRTLVEMASDGIFIESITGDILDCNQAGLKMFGYTREEMLQLNIRDLMLADDAKKLPNIITDEMTTGDTPHETINLRKDATVFPSEIVTKLININGQKRIIAYLRDITVRKEYEKSLKESESKLKELNASKDKFFSIIAHDLRNPVNVILNFIKLLYNRYDELNSDDIKNILKDLQGSAVSTSELLENLLHWSRSQRGKIDFKPELIDMAELAYNSTYIYNHQAKQKNINLKSSIKENTLVFADKNMIDTIIRNLVTNAIKFTPNDGEINIYAVEHDNHWDICIADTGVGISEEDQSKLFRIDIAHTTIGTNYEKGTGVGLILCKEFISRHKTSDETGNIFVRSELGNGSTFIFTLQKYIGTY